VTDDGERPTTTTDPGIPVPRDEFSLESDLRRALRQGPFDTESVLLQENNDDNIALLHQLKCIGVSIVLDDFGTRYSSLSYLKMFLGTRSRSTALFCKWPRNPCRLQSHRIRHHRLRRPPSNRDHGRRHRDRGTMRAIECCWMRDRARLSVWPPGAQG
jgi:hypothetical protein